MNNFLHVEFKNWHPPTARRLSRIDARLRKTKDKRTIKMMNVKDNIECKVLKNKAEALRLRRRARRCGEQEAYSVGIHRLVENKNPATPPRMPSGMRPTGCNTRKTILIFFALFISLISINAQSNFRPGYIITNEMDTISGLIDYRTDAMNALVCNFKTDVKSRKQTYLPGSIFGYRLPNEGKFYISKQITINNVSLMIFAEYLVQGVANLYFYADSRDPSSPAEYYLFEDETGKMTAVTKKPDQNVNIEGGTYLKVDNLYKGVIHYLFQKSDAAIKDIDRLQFTQQSMIDITKDYHKQICTTGKDCIVFTGTPDKRPYLFNFSVYAGYQIYHETGFENAGAPLIGVRMNTIAPRFNKYLSLQLDLSVSHIFTKYGEIYNENNYQYKYSQILMPIKFGGKYTFGKYKLRPSAELGTVFFFNNTVATEYENNVEVAHETYYFDGGFGYYVDCGLDYVLKIKPFIFIGASIDRVSIIGVNLIQFKLGYTW